MAKKKAVVLTETNISGVYDAIDSSNNIIHVIIDSESKTVIFNYFNSITSIPIIDVYNYIVNGGTIVLIQDNEEVSTTKASITVIDGIPSSAIYNNINYKLTITPTETSKITNQLTTVTDDFKGIKFDSDGSGKGQTDYIGGSVTIQSSTDGSEYYIVCDCGIAKHLTVDSVGRLSWTKIDGENVTNVNGMYICERCGKKYDLVEGTNIKNAASSMIFNATNVDDVPVKE